MGMLLRRRKAVVNLTHKQLLAQETEPSVVLEEVETKKDFTDPIIEEIPTEEIVEEVSEEVEFPYSKTAISKMSTIELKKIAKKYGIDKNLAGYEIKKQLIDKYNL